MGIQLVQGNSATSTTTIATQSVAYTSANGVGNFLFLYIAWSGTGVNSVTVADTAGNTWVSNYDNGNADQSAVFTVPICKNGANTVTVTPVGGSFTAATTLVGEFTGVGAADIVFTETVSTGTGTITTPSITGTYAYEIFFACFQGSNTIPTAPYNNLMTPIVGATIVSFNIVNAIGAQSASTTAAGGFWSAGIMSFRGNSSGANMSLLGIS